tara:strand:- start:6578 stop:7621 length:1044 start_codon:yes stop_codon:yes gene_type:complete
MIDINFWKNKKVLITGHSGFKGFWLYKLLERLESNVLGISIKDNSSEIYKIFADQKVAINEKFIDILDESNLNDEITKFAPDIIFHLAAQSLVIDAKTEPKNTIMVNIVGSFNLLNISCFQDKRVGIVVATTDKVYKQPEIVNDEESPLGSFEFYGASKVGLENIINAINNDSKNRNKISVVRSGNVIGGGDGAKGRIMTDLVDSINSNQRVILRNPESIRPWQFVLDSLGGYLLVAEENYIENKPEKYNLNSPSLENVTVHDLSTKLIERFDSNIEINFEKNIKLKESKELRLSSEKAVNKLKWKSFYDIDQIVDNIFLWESGKQSGEVLSITKNQIDEYLQMIDS